MSAAYLAYGAKPMRSLLIAVGAALLLTATTARANTFFSDDDRTAFHTLMMQYLSDVRDVPEAGMHADADTSFCFRMFFPSLEHLSAHLEQSNALFELSVKMRTLEDENLVLDKLQYALIGAQDDTREVEALLKAFTKCTTNPNFSTGQAAIEKAVNPVAAGVGSFLIRLREHFLPSHQ